MALTRRQFLQALGITAAAAWLSGAGIPMPGDAPPIPADAAPMPPRKLGFNMQGWWHGRLGQGVPMPDATSTAAEILEQRARYDWRDCVPDASAWGAVTQTDGMANRMMIGTNFFVPSHGSADISATTIISDAPQHVAALGAATCEAGTGWLFKPHMDVLTYGWLQLSPLHIRRAAASFGLAEEQLQTLCDMALHRQPFTPMALAGGLGLELNHAQQLADALSYKTDALERLNHATGWDEDTLNGLSHDDSVLSRVDICPLDDQLETFMHNYAEALRPYIDQAMDAGAEGVVIGTELQRLNQALERTGQLHLWHYVTDLIPAGKEIIYAALWMEHPGTLKAMVEANPRITSIGLDFYPILPQLEGEVTPEAVEKALTEPYPLNLDPGTITAIHLFDGARAALKERVEQRLEAPRLPTDERENLENILTLLNDGQGLAQPAYWCWQDYMRALAIAVERPVQLTEVGLCSVRELASNPGAWEANITSTLEDGLHAQAAFVEGVMRAFFNEPALSGGISWWMLYVPTSPGQADMRDYSIIGKPAGEVWKHWYAQHEKPRAEALEHKQFDHTVARATQAYHQARQLFEAASLPSDETLVGLVNRPAEATLTL